MQRQKDLDKMKLLNEAKRIKLEIERLNLIDEQKQLTKENGIYGGKRKQNGLEEFGLGSNNSLFYKGIKE